MFRGRTGDCWANSCRPVASKIPQLTAVTREKYALIISIATKRIIPCQAPSWQYKFYPKGQISLGPLLFRAWIVDPDPSKRSLCLPGNQQKLETAGDVLAGRELIFRKQCGCGGRAIFFGTGICIEGDI